MNKEFTGSKENALEIRAAAALLGGEAPTNTRIGVCSNLHKLAPGCDAYGLVKDAAETWPHTRRDPDGRQYGYFVPKKDGYGLWEGPNLDMRRDLLRHIIAYIDATFGVEEVSCAEAELYQLALTWSEAQFLRDVLGDTMQSDGEGTAVFNKLEDMGFTKGVSIPEMHDLKEYEGQRKPT